MGNGAGGALQVHAPGGQRADHGAAAPRCDHGRRSRPPPVSAGSVVVRRSRGRPPAGPGRAAGRTPRRPRRGPARPGRPRRRRGPSAAAGTARCAAAGPGRRGSPTAGEPGSSRASGTRLRHRRRAGPAGGISSTANSTPDSWASQRGSSWATASRIRSSKRCARLRYSGTSGGASMPRSPRPCRSRRLIRRTAARAVLTAGTHSYRAYPGVPTVSGGVPPGRDGRAARQNGPPARHDRAECPGWWRYRPRIGTVSRCERCTRPCLPGRSRSPRRDRRGRVGRALR